MTLFETIPRQVTFEPLSSYSAGVTGNTIRIDGVPVIGGTGADTDATGTLQAMIQLRDGVTVDMQAQLDEVARSLVAIFAESDQSGGGGPDLAGLFTYAGGPAIPAAGTIATGISQTIRVNASFDPSLVARPGARRPRLGPDPPAHSRPRTSPLRPERHATGDRADPTSTADRSPQRESARFTISYTSFDSAPFDAIRSSCACIATCRDSS